MIVDTSALVAIINDEPEGAAFFQLLKKTERPLLSAGNWLELTAVMIRQRLPMSEAELQPFLADCNIVIEPVSLNQADLARDACRRYGRGTGHPARLNFGDCFAYALARDTGQPLLFKGDDFPRTDVVAAA